jgi:hypothetical protein
LPAATVQTRKEEVCRPPLFKPGRRRFAGHRCSNKEKEEVCRPPLFKPGRRRFAGRRCSNQEGGGLPAAIAGLHEQAGRLLAVRWNAEAVREAGRLPQAAHAAANTVRVHLGHPKIIKYTYLYSI